MKFGHRNGGGAATEMVTVSEKSMDEFSRDPDFIAPAPKPDPFETPMGSMPVSANASSTALDRIAPRNYFHSRRVRKGEIEKPWLEKVDPKEKWVTILPVLGIVIGLALAGFLVWDGLNSVSNFTYCTILDDDFSEGFNADIWTKEVECGGYGNGEFEETTNTDENVFVQDGMLWIKPTLQDASLVEEDNVVNLLEQGICSSTVYSDCVMATNTTNGTIIRPTKSGRVTTLNSKSIKYGRIEVEAKLPSGDWLWPAIWMLPVTNTYGPWPESGEIDIMESRGNNYTFPQGGNDIVTSTLHWGPDSTYDEYWRTSIKRQALHTTYASGFHKYGLEWSPKYLFTFIDTRLLQVLYVKFNKPFWDKGDFPVDTTNGTVLTDPWNTGRDQTPFDQDFYLIMNVAVGGTNGWFKDGTGGKPWVDDSTEAELMFWNAQDEWYPTWEKNGAMQVKSVKMFQQKGYNGCD